MGHRISYRNGAGLRTAVCLALLAVLSVGLGGCSSTSKSKGKSAGSHINTKTKFSVAEYGVAASPRLTTAKRPKKGGGRSFVGKPYRVRGKWYTPKEDPDYDRAGLASWYGPNFHGRLTANGEIYDQFHLSAAHPTFPLPSYAKVTNKKNGNSVIVRVNDRGPFAHGRIIDVSSKAAELLAMKNDGVAAVRVEYVGRAPVEGDDTRYLVASYRPGGSSAPAEGVIASGVMMAMNAVDSALPGVGSSTMAPPAALGHVAPPALQAGATTLAALPTEVPAGFVLPSIGPVLPERPSFGVPVAANAGSGMRDLGMAFWGGRVISSAAPFEAILAGSSDQR
ncbi:septal ring lytic transglycosylase RlpA family protein [Hoeflea sp. YIM 152468]|uniref:septal ring lytic transglycosylase RlpA family protein n=1 Tax=Hoeflea sp. YIM 152468 TaxID=3031759 RepID=UPI0023DAD6F8|nr:septal ring lytic transglycosylase RlpA family protein [Hoeflea sp. YIM 152468]MDF1608994.1 septal ring lytic transglycosylase RlpA family protein [Hoeflea sp. YIM 152468]